ncbi:MAG: carbohydrate ABC transporter permease [Turicibacter sp.]
MKIERSKFVKYKMKLRKKLLGNNGDGLLQQVMIYVLLITIGFVFLYPLIMIVSYSFKDSKDIINPLVEWIPTQFYLGNYEKAFMVLDFWKSLGQTIVVTGLPALIQTISCSLIGYGFAKFKFPGKNIWFGLVLATFIIPPQITVIPQFLMFKDLQILDSILAYILPAMFGQGLRSAIFIFIFYQFFKMVPVQLIEAAKVDGASAFKIFMRISLPMSTPAYIISFLFSFVWYWNETYLASMFFGQVIQTLPMKLDRFVATYSKMYQIEGAVGGQTLNEAIEMAGTFLIILPLLIIYFITQKWFVESIDHAGLTGE